MKASPEADGLGAGILGRSREQRIRVKPLWIDLVHTRKGQFGETQRNVKRKIPEWNHGG
jgi:hypothetical protein